jgi:hypothetical protein
LLDVLKLLQDATVSFATEELREITFVCLFGNPRFEGNFDFQGIMYYFRLTVPGIVTPPTYRADSVILCWTLTSRRHGPRPVLKNGS